MPSPWPDADLASLIPAEQRAAIEGEAVGEHRQAAVAFICFKHTDHLLADGGIGALDGPLQRLADCTATSVARHAVHWLASDAYADGGKLILAGGVPATGVHDEEHLLRAVRATSSTTSAVSSSCTVASTGAWCSPGTSGRRAAGRTR